MSKKARPVTFRPTEEVRKWLEVGQLAGFDMSKVINTILASKPSDGERTEVETFVKSNIERRRKHLAELLEEPTS